MRHVHALAALLLLTTRAPTPALAGGRCDGFSGICSTKGTRTSCNNHDGCSWSTFFTQCEGIATPCTSYKSRWSCEGNNSGGRRCEWTEDDDGDGVPFGPTLPPTPPPTGAPTTRCDMGFDVKEYSDDVEPPMGMHFVDLNGDGRVDRLGFVSNGSSEDGDAIIFWHELMADGTYIKRILDDAENEDVRDLAVADLDGDGLVDIAYSESGSRCCDSSFDRFTWGSIGWYRNLGNGEFVGPTKLSERKLPGAYHIEAADVDGDGMIDLIVNSDSSRVDVITWWKNLGDGSFSEKYTHENGRVYFRIIDDSLGSVSSLVVQDANGDGMIDVLVSTSSYPKTSWYMNDNGSFTEILVTDERQIRQSIAVDFDSDGDVDVIGSAKDGVYWYEYKADGSYDEHHLAIVSKGPDETTIFGGGAILAIDINGDGLLDLVVDCYSTSHGKQQDWLVLFENMGNGVFEDRAIAVTEGSYKLHAMDYNSDGFVDIVREKHVLETLGECFGVPGPQETANQEAQAPAKPAPAPVPSLESFGYGYTQDAADGWLVLPPNVYDDLTLEFGAATVEECAAECQDENAISGSWNSREERCWCYFVTGQGTCLEPCIKEEGIEFSKMLYAELEFCEKSFCHKDLYYGDFQEYCDDNFDQDACDAEIESRQKPASSASPTSFPWSSSVALGLIATLPLLI